MKILLNILKEATWSGATRAYHTYVRKSEGASAASKALSELGKHKQSEKHGNIANRLTGRMRQAYHAVPKNPKREEARNKRSIKMSDFISANTHYNKLVNKYKDKFSK